MYKYKHRRSFVGNRKPSGRGKEFSAALGEAGFGEPEKDKAEDGLGVLLRCEAAVGAELVGGGPEAFLQRVVGSVSFRWGDPVHKFCQTDEGAKASGNQD